MVVDYLTPQAPQVGFWVLEITKDSNGHESFPVRERLACRNVLPELPFVRRLSIRQKVPVVSEHDKRRGIRDSSKHEEEQGCDCADSQGTSIRSCHVEPRVFHGRLTVSLSDERRQSGPRERLGRCSLVSHLSQSRSIAPSAS